MWIALAVAMGAVPVTTPLEWGRLHVVSVTQEERGHQLELEYLDDTQAGVEAVAVECSSLDSRGSVLHTGRVWVKSPGREPKTVKMLLKALIGGVERIECQLVMGKSRKVEP